MLLITRQKQFPLQPIADGRGDGWCCSLGHRQPLGTLTLPSLPRKSKEEVAQPQGLQLAGALTTGTDPSARGKRPSITSRRADSHHVEGMGKAASQDPGMDREDEGPWGHRGPSSVGLVRARPW